VTPGFLQDPDAQLIAMFREEVDARLDVIDQGLSREAPALDDLRREAHTLNGAAAMLGLIDLAELASEMEGTLAGGLAAGTLTDAESAELRAASQRFRQLSAAA